MNSSAEDTSTCSRFPGHPSHDCSCETFSRDIESVKVFMLPLPFSLIYNKRKRGMCRQIMFRPIFLSGELTHRLPPLPLYPAAAATICLRWYPVTTSHWNECWMIGSPQIAPGLQGHAALPYGAIGQLDTFLVSWPFANRIRQLEEHRTSNRPIQSDVAYSDAVMWLVTMRKSQHSLWHSTPRSSCCVIQEFWRITQIASRVHHPALSTPLTLLGPNSAWHNYIVSENKILYVVMTTLRARQARYAWCIFCSWTRSPFKSCSFSDESIHSGGTHLFDKSNTRSCDLGEYREPMWTPHLGLEFIAFISVVDAIDRQGFQHTHGCSCPA